MRQRLIILLFLSFCTMSCDDWLKEDPINKLSMNTTDDLEFALTGLYHQFGDLNCMDLLLNRDDFAYITSSSNTNGVCIRRGSSLTPDEWELLSVYLPLYKSIASANDIIQKSRTLNLGDPKITYLLGEVYFIRAYAYFWLVRLFGQIPIIDNVDVDYSVKRSSFLEIYSFIEKDLQVSIHLLPNTSHEARRKYVTPHRGSAKALLAEVYLNWGGYPVKDRSMYSKSANLAKEVIDSAAYFGFGLMPDLADLWNGKHLLNQESVFSIYGASYLKSSGSILPGIKFYNSFPNNYRKDITYMRRRVYLYKPDCIIDSLNPENTYCPPSETIEYRFNLINACVNMYFRKGYTQFNVSDSLLAKEDFYSVRNKDNKIIYLLRYSHTLLTYAEAMVRSGHLDDSAFEAVNQIRRRANRLDQHLPSTFDLKVGITAEQFADSVVWERAWEFCAEPESRWFDLLRLEKMGNLKSLKDLNDGVEFPKQLNMKTYFYPIPETDLKLNLQL